MAIENFSPDQHLAVEMCCDLAQRICGVTGEAGTGKTTVISEVIHQLADKKLTVHVAAPTGRAAARVRELTGTRARTIHRLLGYGMPDPDDPDDTTFPERSKFNPLTGDVFLIDESSMMSEELYRNLIDALPRHASIRFFGDMHQLPPVNVEGEPPFKRILEKYPKVILTKNFRSTDGIVQAAQSIIKGFVPRTNAKFTLLNISKQMGLSVIDKFIDEDLATMAAQLIAPTRVGKLGTNILNGYLQQKLNNQTRSLQLKYILDGGQVQDITFRPGDKILWTKNDYQLNLFNGMIGKLLDFDEHTGAVATEFEGRDYTIPPYIEIFDDGTKKPTSYDPRKSLDLAYAITTHKSQGSEFNRVLLLMYWSIVLSRENFYTAVTRGREHVTVIAAPGALKAAMRLDKDIDRSGKK